MIITMFDDVSVGLFITHIDPACTVMLNHVGHCATLLIESMQTGTSLTTIPTIHHMQRDLETHSSQVVKSRHDDGDVAEETANVVAGEQVMASTAPNGESRPITTRC